MVLTPHAVLGSAIASALRLSPPLAFVAGLASHYLLDTVPHWDYDLVSAKIDSANPLNNDIDTSGWPFVIDLVKIGFDACLGLSLSLFFFGWAGEVTIISLVFASLGGVLPDVLQFTYTKVRREPFVAIQRFHNLMHAKTKIVNVVPGVFWHCLLILLALVLGNWFYFTF